jgi:hypothetical protein
VMRIGSPTMGRIGSPHRQAARDPRSGQREPRGIRTAVS